MKQGDIANITIGKGGKGATTDFDGKHGEDSIIIINNNSYIGGGGGGGVGGTGGTGTSSENYGPGKGTIPGMPGGAMMNNRNADAWLGGAGGGSGGGSGVMWHYGSSIPNFLPKTNSGGGGGGSSGYSAQDGSDGVCWIEYFDPKKK